MNGAPVSVVVQIRVKALGPLVVYRERFTPANNFPGKRYNRWCDLAIAAWLADWTVIANSNRISFLCAWVCPFSGRRARSPFETHFAKSKGEGYPLP
ncbi:hypothetical protein SAMN05443244_1213 [Terriglobus roseus]|uniref:Uncharacterized protein n=1 Tax=Terriglobus roseus TaxID=392734 RepID=A0A1H4KJJ7_9BACT|nr:hypothetical protein SAMN05443244_1213 [Terriglobus roseus]